MYNFASAVSFFEIRGFIVKNWLYIWFKVLFIAGHYFLPSFG